MEKELNDAMEENIIFEKNGEFVKIIDNFFSDNIVEKIIDYFNKNKWNSQCFQDPNFIRNKADSPYWRIELENENFFYIYLFNIIEKYIGKKLVLNRIYAVGQTYGQNSIFHLDDNEKNTFTFCYYINEKIYDDGLFYLKIQQKKYITAIETNKNRAILFPSNYIHKGSELNRYNNNFRICIAWKYKIIE